MASVAFALLVSRPSVGGSISFFSSSMACSVFKFATISSIDLVTFSKLFFLSRSVRAMESSLAI